MKRDKIIYWVSTIAIALMMAFSGFNYFTNPAMKDGFAHLGFPDYFRIELGAAKLIGALLLVVPAVPNWLKEWTYAGFGITFVSAAIAHSNSGDPAGMVVAPLVFLVFLAVSYGYFRKLNSLHNQLV